MSIKLSTWQPLAKKAHFKKIETICRHLRASLLDKARRQKNHAALADSALFLRYFEKTYGENQSEEIHSILSSGLQLASEAPMSLTLFGGQMHTAWVVQHLDSSPNKKNSKKTLADFHALVMDALQGPADFHHDVVSGLVGIGVYGWESQSSQVLKAVVRLLWDSSQPSPDGTAWWSDPKSIGPLNRKKFPKGVFDMGLAHGAAGILSFLSAVSSPAPKKRLKGAAHWFVAQARDAQWPRFPTMFSTETQSVNGGLSWCY